jgi:hypothetical protein
MSARIVEALSTALARVASEVGAEASAVEAFIADDWAKFKATITAARAKFDDTDKHNIDDAVGVVSHTSGGQPFTADQRLDMALKAMPDTLTEAPAQPVSPTEGANHVT